MTLTQMHTRSNTLCVMQVALDENGQEHIPEHELVTRRKQFRMKKDKRENKRLKKAQALVDKEKKKEDKQAKKAEKDRKKKEKKEAKEEEKQTKKRGRTAAEKAPRKRSLQQTPEESTGPSTEDVITEVTTEVCEAAVSTSPTTKKAHNRGLRKLRKIRNLPPKKANRGKQTAEQGGTTGGSNKGTGGSDSPKKAHTSSESKKGTKRAAEKLTAKTSKTETVDEKKDQKALKSPKKTKQRKEKKPSEETETPIDPAAKELVASTLKECVSSNCCHPNFEWVEINKNVCELSTYWSRMAVGIKTDPAGGAKKSKEKKPKRTQVAYFSHPTICTYSNLAVAGLYVSCPTCCLQPLDAKLRL